MGLQNMDEQDEHCMFVDLPIHVVGVSWLYTQTYQNPAIIQGPLNVLVYNPSKASSIYSMGDLQDPKLEVR